MSPLEYILTKEFKEWLTKTTKWGIVQDNPLAKTMERMVRLEDAARRLHLEMDIVSKEIARVYRAEKKTAKVGGSSMFIYEMLTDWMEIKNYIENIYNDWERSNK